MIIRGIDSDNYDGPVPGGHYRRLHDEFAARFNILGLEAGMPYVTQQRVASLDAGLDVPFGYKFLYWQPSDLERMKQACAAQLPIAIDCEHPTNWGAGQVEERILQAKDLLLLEGLYWGIYTGRPWWQQHTNDSIFLDRDRWWHASYPFGDKPPTNLPPVEYPFDRIGDEQLRYALMPGIKNYGGHDRCEVWQYANTCYLDELGEWDFDMNVMWVPDAPEPGRPLDVDEELRKLIGVGSRIEGDLSIYTTTGYRMPIHFEGTIAAPPAGGVQ